MNSIFSRCCILLLFYGCFQLSVCEWFIIWYIFFFLPLSVFPWFTFLMGVSQCICIVICDFVRRGDYISISFFFQWWYCSWFLFTFLNLSHNFSVGILEFIEFTNLFHVSFLAFLKTLYLVLVFLVLYFYCYCAF